MKKRKIYVATSWKNMVHPAVVVVLKSLGHEVYDFRNPKPGDNGFSWSEISTKWQSWTFAEYQEALKSREAKRGFKFDMDALNWCDTCFLILPCGRSAHLELGYAVGQKKRTIILNGEDKVMPELMYKMVDYVTDSLMDAKTFRLPNFCF